MKKKLSIWKILILFASMTTLMGMDGCGGDDDDDDYEYDNGSDSGEESSYIPGKKSLSTKAIV